jgi:hypothetical protein
VLVHLRQSERLTLSVAYQPCKYSSCYFPLQDLPWAGVQHLPGMLRTWAWSWVPQNKQTNKQTLNKKILLFFLWYWNSGPSPWTTMPALLVVDIFRIGSLKLLPQCCDLPDLCLLSS